MLPPAFGCDAIIDQMFIPWLNKLLNWKAKIIKRQLEAEEITVLLCVYLDALAKHFLWPLGIESVKARFLELLNRFSFFAGKWNLLSLPDLHGFLLWAIDWSWGMFNSHIGTNIPPNRELYSLLKPFIENSDFYQNILQTLIQLVITEMERSGELVELKDVEDWLYDKLNKTLVVNTHNITQQSLHNFLQCFTLGEIFYRDYRCAAVHELARFNLPGFWEEEAPYVATYEGDPLVYGEGVVLRKIVFPIHFIWNIAWDATQTIKSEFKFFVFKNLNHYSFESRLDIEVALYDWLTKQNGDPESFAIKQP